MPQTYSLKQLEGVGIKMRRIPFCRELIYHGQVVYLVFQNMEPPYFQSQTCGNKCKHVIPSLIHLETKKTHYGDIMASRVSQLLLQNWPEF